MPETCALCGRPAPDLTEHHLIPRSEHARLRGRPGFDREAARQQTVTLCVPCHRTVHAELSSRELRDRPRGRPRTMAPVTWSMWRHECRFMSTSREDFSHAREVSGGYAA